MNTPRKDIHLFMPFRVKNRYKKFLLIPYSLCNCIRHIRKTAVCLLYNEAKQNYDGL